MKYLTGAFDFDCPRCGVQKYVDITASDEYYMDNHSKCGNCGCVINVVANLQIDILIIDEETKGGE